MSALTVGSPAPPLDLPTADGTRRSLEDHRGRPVIVSFLGPAGCTVCRAHVLKVVHARDAIQQLDANVLFVAYHDPELVMSRMMRDIDLPYGVLIDSSGEAYARWGVANPGLRSFLFPATYRAIARMWLGRDPAGTALGGDFVVDREGRLVLVNPLRTVHDRAPVSDLLAAVRTV
jgi:peroxiredoxin